MQASEVMTRNIVSIGRDAPIREAIRLMLDNKVSGLPVVDAGGKVVGILTEGDLLRRSEIATEKRHWPWLEFRDGTGADGERLCQDPWARRRRADDRMRLNSSPPTRRSPTSSP